MNEIIKIALVEDEALLVEGFSSMFLNVENILVVKTANNRSDFLNVLEETSKSNFPDIALVDFQMKPMNGFELVEVLREKHPNLKIIILYSHYKLSLIHI